MLKNFANLFKDVEYKFCLWQGQSWSFYLKMCTYVSHSHSLVFGQTKNQSYWNHKGQNGLCQQIYKNKTAGFVLSNMCMW